MDVTCTVLPCGSLEVTSDEESREELREARERGYWQAFCELFESHMCNGGFTPFDAGDGNPFVGLTSAPCIAEELSADDAGRNHIFGRFWFFADYAIRDPLEELCDTGRTVFAYGGRGDEEESEDAE